jgi:hypothetical protein
MLCYAWVGSNRIELNQYIFYFLLLLSVLDLLYCTKYIYIYIYIYIYDVRGFVVVVVVAVDFE